MYYFYINFPVFLLLFFFFFCKIPVRLVDGVYCSCILKSITIFVSYTLFLHVCYNLDLFSYRLSIPVSLYLLLQLFILGINLRHRYVFALPLCHMTDTPLVCSLRA